MTAKRHTAPEIIGTHLCCDMREVSEGRYQRYSSPAVYVCGSDYFCAPTTTQKLPQGLSEQPWEKVGTYYGRDVYRALAQPDPHAICRKWVKRLGGGFHPDTRGRDYTPALTAEEITDYDADMERLFGCAADPYECGVMAMADAGLA